jgi:uncharacterized protein YjbI with pentapeptide repeats
MAAVGRFDRLDYAQKLERAGVPAEQAALQAKALAGALTGTENLRADFADLRIDFADLRSDLANLRAEVAARFENVDVRLAHLESRLEAKIDLVRSELLGKIETLKWMFGVPVALNGATLIQAFLRH